MSSSSSKPAPPPPTINPQLQHESESTLNIPPDPGSSSHSPLTNSIESSNNHSPILNSQNETNIQTVTFSQVLHYWWGTNEYQSNNHNIASHPTPPQIWMAQNVYPLMTPMRMTFFFLSPISFCLAYGFYMQTKHYKTHVASGGHHFPLILFVAANIGNFVFLILVMFFSFLTAAYERYLHHYLFKSLGEVMVMLIMSFLILGIGHMHQEGHSEVAGLVTCAFLTIYSLCIVILLKPGHHYSLLDATATLTLHLGLEGIYSIPSVVFILVIVVIKNYVWSHNIGHAQAPSNEGHRLVWFASEVADNLSRA